MASKVKDMKQIVEFSKLNGFVYQGSEIYGGLANSWDYGPRGSVLKDNIRALWLQKFVQERTDMVQLDANILMNPQVWVASGHVGGFVEPLMDCKACKNRHRADKIIEEILAKDENAKKPANWAAEKTPLSDLMEYIKSERIVCPDCEKFDWTEIRTFNPMFKTHQWVTDDSSSLIYLRPETAGGIFVNFANIVRTSRKKVPFGVAQVGKAFRNEITPGNFIFRTREFEQMEIEYFIKPGTNLEWHAKWKADCRDFLIGTLGIREENLKFRDHSAEELSHYSNATTDVEYLFPMGWGELWGIADRTDFDLKAHMKESKTDLSYFDPYDNTKYIPHVIEPSVGLTRLFLATLCDSYDEVQTEEGSRVIMRFQPAVAPVKVAVLPIVKKLGAEAMEIYNLLSKHFVCDYDETGAIGKRYFRQDEIGTPFAIAVDGENFAAGQVTVRHRDTGLQDVVKISELVEWVRERVTA